MLDQISEDVISALEMQKSAIDQTIADSLLLLSAQLIHQEVLETLLMQAKGF